MRWRCRARARCSLIRAQQTSGQERQNVGHRGGLGEVTGSRTDVTGFLDSAADHRRPDSRRGVPQPRRVRMESLLERPSSTRQGPFVQSPEYPPPATGSSAAARKPPKGGKGWQRRQRGGRSWSTANISGALSGHGNLRRPLVSTRSARGLRPGRRRPGRISGGLSSARRFAAHAGPVADDKSCGTCILRSNEMPWC